MIFGHKLWILPLANLTVLHFLKLYFSGLKIILFSPECPKTIYSDLISPKNTNKKNFDFWTKTMDYPLRKMSIFFRLFKTLVVWSRIFFYPEYQKTIFSNIITSKTLVRKSLNFGQKPWTNLLGKGRFFGPPQNDTFVV